MTPPSRHQSAPHCTACGQPEAFAFDGGPLCAECAHVRGSCCTNNHEHTATPAHSNDPGYSAPVRG